MVGFGGIVFVKGNVILQLKNEMRNKHCESIIFYINE